MGKQTLRETSQLWSWHLSSSLFALFAALTHLLQRCSGWHRGLGWCIVVPLLLLFSFLIPVPQHGVLYRPVSHQSCKPPRASCLPQLRWLFALPCLGDFLLLKAKIQNQKSDVAPLMFYGTAQKRETELFLVSLSAEEVTIRASMSPKSYHGNYQISLCTLDTTFALKEMRTGHLEIFENHGPSQPTSGSCSKKQMWHQGRCPHLSKIGG